MIDEQTQWSVNETLLQSYRSIFISSQSFMLAVGAIMWDKNHPVLLIIAVISIVMIWRVWYPVVSSRHKIVDYYKHRARLSATKCKQLCTEDEYVHNKTLRDNANKLFELDKNMRETRVKVDIIIPAIFSTIWIILVFSAYWECLAITKPA